MVPAIAHGRVHEKDAVASYAADKTNSGTPVRIRDCGLAVSTDYQYIGASPDGVVFNKSANPHFGLLKVKCPYSAFTKSQSGKDAATQEKGFCLEAASGSPRLRKDHPYYWQVQGQLAVTGMQWCDFVVWIGESLFIQRAHYDSDLWLATILPSLLAFYSSHALPYLTRLSRCSVPSQGSCSCPCSCSISNTTAPHEGV